MGYWRHRTLCDVLEAMRNCQKTHNYSPLAGLIEEAQILANKMEAGLYYQKDIEELHQERKKLEKKVKKLRKETGKKKKKGSGVKQLLNLP